MLIVVFLHFPYLLIFLMNQTRLKVLALLGKQKHETLLTNLKQCRLLSQTYYMDKYQWLEHNYLFTYAHIAHTHKDFNTGEGAMVQKRKVTQQLHSQTAYKDLNIWIGTDNITKKKVTILTKIQSHYNFVGTTDKAKW